MEKVSDLSIKKLKVSELHTHPNNARQGDVGAIVQSLEAHGQYRPIVVQKSTMNVVAGNHTLLAANALGWETIEATIIDVDDDQALRILLVDNRVSDMATYDEAILSDLLQDLAEQDDFLEGTGFDGDDLEDLLFKLNGSTGFLGDAQSSAERKEAWENAGVRSIILPYKEEEYNELIGLMNDLRASNGAESNAELVSILVRQGNANS